VKHSGLNQPVDPAVYAPFPQSDEAWRRWMTLAIRTPGASAELIEDVKKQVWSVDSQIPVREVHSMEDLMGVSLAQQSFNMLLLGLFAALAWILATVGIYGMMAYRVGQRMHEIGIYIALGAQRRDVLRLVLGDGAKLAFFGIAMGIAGAIALTRVMTSLLLKSSRRTRKPCSRGDTACYRCAGCLFTCRHAAPCALIQSSPCATNNSPSEDLRFDDHAFAAAPAMVSPNPLIGGLRGGPS